MNSDNDSVCAPETGLCSQRAKITIAIIIIERVTEGAQLLSAAYSKIIGKKRNSASSLLKNIRNSETKIK